MQARIAVLAALVVAVTLTSAAAARPDASRQRVAITMRNLPTGTFVLAPVEAGALKLDSGTVRHIVANYSPRLVVRDGQSASIFKPVVWQLKGKRGTLLIREPANEWVETGGPSIGTGRWHVVRGTGQYAGVGGGGRTAHAGDDGARAWVARQEGVLTVP